MQVSGNEIRIRADLIWGIAELLRGDYKQADYGKVILPLVVMRRLDQVLEDRRRLRDRPVCSRTRRAPFAHRTGPKRARSPPAPEPPRRLTEGFPLFL